MNHAKGGKASMSASQSALLAIAGLLAVPLAANAALSSGTVSATDFTSNGAMTFNHPPFHRCQQALCVDGFGYFFFRAFRRAVCTLTAAATTGFAQLGVWVIRVSRSGSMIFWPRMRNTRVVWGSPSADSALLSNT
jgi:hypothetical protein